MIKNIIKYPLLLLFFLFMAGMFIADMITPPTASSEMENRPLKQRPDFSLEELWANEYTLEYEEFVNDQFVGRDGWITTKSIAESALQKIENNGIAYGSDGYMFEKYVNLDSEQLSKNIGYVGEFLELHPELNVTLGIIPNSYEVLTEKTPTAFVNLPQAPLIDEIYSGVKAENLQTIDILSTLVPHAGEYIYYRTDHHWTTDGAYYTYAAFCDAVGKSAVDKEVLTPLMTEEQDFYGTYYSKAKLYNAVPDTITWYDIPTTSVEIVGIEDAQLYDMDKFDTRDKYGAFLYGNNGLTVIKSATNQTEGDGSKILLIKDSYGNSFAPYLCYNYDEVWVVDLRHVLEIASILEQNEFEDVLIMYNYMNFVEDTNLAKLRY